jgi:hypothetical protein
VRTPLSLESSHSQARGFEHLVDLGAGPVIGKAILATVRQVVEVVAVSPATIARIGISTRGRCPAHVL